MPDFDIDVGLNTSPFDAGLGRLRGNVARWGQGLAGQFAAIAAPAALAAGIGKLIADANRLKDLGETFTIPVETLQKLGGAAKVAGTDLETIAKQGVKLNGVFLEAAYGNERYANALAVMGLSAEELVRLPLDKQMVRLSQGFQNAEKSGRGTWALLQLLGRSAGEIVPLMRQGPAALQAAMDAVKPASKRAIDSIDDVSDRWDTFVANAKAKATGWLGSVAGFFADLAADKAAFEALGSSGTTAKSKPGLLERMLGGKFTLPPRGSGKPAAPSSTPATPESAPEPLPGPLPASPETIEGADEARDKARTAAEARRKAAMDEAARAKDLRGEAERLRGQAGAAKERMGIGGEPGEQARKRYWELQEQINKALAEAEGIERRLSEEAIKQADAAAKEADVQAAKDRELDVEMQIAELRGDAEAVARREAEIRLSAAERELDLARGTRNEKAAAVAVAQARQAFDQTHSSEKEKFQGSVEENLLSGMSTGDAKKAARRSEREHRRREAAVERYRRAREEAPSLMEQYGARGKVVMGSTQGENFNDKRAGLLDQHGKASADATEGGRFEVVGVSRGGPPTRSTADNKDAAPQQGGGSPGQTLSEMKQLLERIDQKLGIAVEE